MLRVGLTGSIGSGKSEVARLLAAYGAVVIDADELAREVVEPGSQGYTDVVAAFGAEVVSADGSLDRAALAEQVFADGPARRRLEAVIHPRVRALARQLEAQAGPDAIVVHDIPLLVEAAGADRFDVVIVIDVPEDEAVRRLRGRGMSAADARRRMRAQASREHRRAAADVVIDNSGGLDALAEKVDALWVELAARAALSRR